MRSSTKIIICFTLIVLLATAAAAQRRQMSEQRQRQSRRRKLPLPRENAISVPMRLRKSLRLNLQLLQRIFTNSHGPDFLTEVSVIEHDDAGKGKISFLKDGYDGMLYRPNRFGGDAEEDS